MYGAVTREAPSWWKWSTLNNLAAFKKPRGDASCRAASNWEIRRFSSISAALKSRFHRTTAHGMRRHVVVGWVRP